METLRLKLIVLALATVPVLASAQVPDLVNAFDAGGRAVGMGGVTNVTGSDTLSNYYNPAGLGYVTRSTLGLTFRNMPESRSVVTGDIGPGGTQRFATSNSSGATGLGHAGLAFPLKGRNGSTNGTIGISVTKGGQLRDLRVSGAGLTEGGLNAVGYTQLIKSSTDFINLSYGRTAGDGAFNYGVGLVFATNRQMNNKLAPSGTSTFDADANGLGFQAGILVNPTGNNLSFGASVRTPIKLRGGGGNTLIYDKIPGRLSAGVAFRQDGFRGGRDYMVLGGELSYFFGGSNSPFIDRDTQTVFGIGGEYHYSMGSSVIPVRIGYSFVQKGGNFFGSRNSLTFGLGYRPSNGDWGIDVNWGRPQNGGGDLSLSLVYRFGK